MCETNEYTVSHSPPSALPTEHCLVLTTSSSAFVSALLCVFADFSGLLRTSAFQDSLSPSNSGGTNLTLISIPTPHSPPPIIFLSFHCGPKCLSEVPSSVLAAWKRDLKFGQIHHTHTQPDDRIPRDLFRPTLPPPSLGWPSAF
eukprot:RCo051838